MRGLKALAGTAAMVALAGISASVRADDYNKMMTFTFNNSVQLPGATLEPGTYMFKLADPESGRRTVQVWDKNGTKMYTMALTVVDRRNEVAADPTKFKDGLVMFSEQPAGIPQAIRTWFYTGDTIGYEFVYPKDQAEKIAKAYHTSVLATNASTGGADAAALRGSKVGRIDENGQFADDTNSVTASASASNSSQQASTTTAASTTNTSSSTTTTTAAEPTLTPSANRTPPASPPAPARAAASTTTAQSASNQQPQPVGTAGQTAPRPADTTAANATLPKTASPLATMELMSGLSLLLALGVRQLRRRQAES